MDPKGCDMEHQRPTSVRFVIFEGWVKWTEGCVDLLCYLAESDGNHSALPKIFKLLELIVLDGAPAGKHFAQHLGHCAHTDTTSIFTSHCCCASAVPYDLFEVSHSSYTRDM